MIDYKRSRLKPFSVYKNTENMSRYHKPTNEVIVYLGETPSPHVKNETWLRYYSVTSRKIKTDVANLFGFNEVEGSFDLFVKSLKSLDQAILLDALGIEFSVLFDSKASP